MSGTNPDQRPLPDGWFTQYDDKSVDGPDNPDRAQLTCHLDSLTLVTRLGRTFTLLLMFKYQFPIPVAYPGSTSIQRPIRPPQAGPTHSGLFQQIRLTPSLILQTNGPHIVWGAPGPLGPITALRPSPKTLIHVRFQPAGLPSMMKGMYRSLTILFLHSCFLDRTPLRLLT